MEAMSLTGAHIALALRSAGAGGGLVMGTAAIAEAFNDAIEKYGEGLFTTADRVAALVSECMMESAYFRTTEEYNTKKGDYQPYRGRTFIQITWKSNYIKFGEWCKQQRLISDANYFVKNPSRLADLEWAAIGGVWYFTQVDFYGKPLVEYSGNIGQVGKAVNLGDPYHKVAPNGWKAREDAYKAVRALGDSIAFPPPTPPQKPQPEWKEDMKNVYFGASKEQALKVGEQDVRINNDGDVSVISGQNKAVDVEATVSFNLIPPPKTRLFWRIVDYKSGENKIAHNRKPVTAHEETQVVWKGAIPDGSAKDRTMRLRLVVQVPEGTVGLKITGVQISGWKMDD